jgi:hypothetical protein
MNNELNNTQPPPEELRLVLDVSWDHFAYGLFDRGSECKDRGKMETGKLQLAGQLLDKFREFQSLDIFKQHYSETQIVWNGLNHTMVPEELLLRGNEDAYLKFANVVHSGDQVRSDKTLSFGGCVVYSIPSILREAFSEFWPAHHLHHIASVLLEQIVEKSNREQLKTCCIINIKAQSFDLLIAQGSKPVYCNTFEYRTPAELIYYSQYTFGQLGINREDTPVMISGAIDTRGQLYENLRDYFSLIALADDLLILKSTL